MEKKQRRYSVDFKYKVVRAYLDSDKTQLEICEEYGISRSSLIKWKKQLQENGIDALQNKKSAPRCQVIQLVDHEQAILKPCSQPE